MNLEIAAGLIMLEIAGLLFAGLMFALLLWSSPHGRREPESPRCRADIPEDRCLWSPIPSCPRKFCIAHCACWCKGHKP